MESEKDQIWILSLKLFQGFRSFNLLSVLVTNEDKKARRENDHQISCWNLATHGKKYFQIFDRCNEKINRRHDNCRESIMLQSRNLKQHFIFPKKNCKKNKIPSLKFQKLNSQIIQKCLIINLFSEFNKLSKTEKEKF